MLAPYIFSLLSALAPLDRGEAPPYPEAFELAVDREERFTEIADDVDRAVRYLQEADRLGAAELLLAIAWHESKLLRDVDLGPCAGASKGRCDHGLARGLWQLHGTAPDMPRAEQARLSIRRALGSLRACRHRDAAERLALYASGASCDDAVGRARSREIWADLGKVRALRIARPKKQATPAPGQG